MEPKDPNVNFPQPSPTPMDNVGPKTSYPSPRFLSKKLAIIFLGIIALIFLVGVGAFVLGKNSQNQPAAQNTVSTSPSPSTKTNLDWKTYTNTKFGYSIDYLWDDKITEFPEVEGNNAIILNRVQISLLNSMSGEYSSVPQLDITVGKKTSFDSSQVATKATINGLPASTLDYDDSRNWSHHVIEFLKNGQYFTLDFNSSTKDKVSVRTYFDKMLSTFKFTQ